MSICIDIAFCSTRKKKRTNQPQHSRRCRSRLGNKLVSSDKRASAHCSGIRDEQRCENVTTNSLWSPNVISSLSLVLHCCGSLSFFLVFIIFHSFPACFFLNYNPYYFFALKPLLCFCHVFQKAT